MVMQSEKIDLLSAALVKFQGAMPPVPESSKNPFYESTYADLADIVKVAQPHLLENGLAVTQWPGHKELRTTVLHASGQWMSGEMGVFMDKETSQAQGSALTYSRRYAYCAALGIVTGKDDDGNAAGQEGREEPAPVDPVKKEAMDAMVAAVKAVTPEGQQERLISHIHGKFGATLSMTLDQVKEATVIAKSWPPPQAESPDLPVMDEQPSEGEKF